MNLFPAFFFREQMAGTHERAGQRELPFHFDVSVNCLEVSRPLEEIVGQCQGKLTMAGVAEDAPAEGTLELAPFSKRVVRYALRFPGLDGRRYRFEGQKQIRWLRPLTSWTTLDGEVFEEGSGASVGKVKARFDLRRQLGPLLGSFRLAEVSSTLRRQLGPDEREASAHLARAILPPGRRFRGGGEETVERACELVAEFSPAAAGYLGALALLLDRAAVLRTGRRFRALEPEKQQALLRRWERDPLIRLPLFLFAFAVKAAHFDDPEIYASLGATYAKGGKPEPARWLSQVRPGRSITSDETLECEVVVVGTGAGGAVVGKELAERGHAVLLLEEGEHYRRDAFIGRARGTHGRFYRLKGSLAVGNGIVPVLMGRMVGGSTAVNTGTCFRTPEWVLSRWCEDLGTGELAREKLDPHFERVERELEVERAKWDALGGAAKVVARGCDALGWSHFPLLRNAPGCDGQGVCDFGCPTDARKSTNLSYVPRALERGAQLCTGSRAEKVLLEGGRAVGVEARTAGGGHLTVRAQAVVLAGGAIPTPLLLLKQGLCSQSGQVGRNLSLHPATAVSALFEERIAGYNAIPQGYCCDQFHREGMLLLGASAPIDVAANMFPFTGKRLMEVMEAYDRIASFGVMVEDEGRGRVRPRPDGSPAITYFLSKRDVERLQQGMAHIGEIFLAAGAKKLFPLLQRMPELEGREGLKRLSEANLRAWDFFATSFHPLGTCRMGTDPKKSVVGLDHQSHEVERLFIVDGSALPGPTAVNPQVTIMAFADRAARLISERLA
ncbi:MAG: GMC family oxidoreductase [Myxococcales bacterium]|nr:GMC family oxidoreductase [Myxococcales bacterium]